MSSTRLVCPEPDCYRVNSPVSESSRCDPQVFLEFKPFFWIGGRRFYVLIYSRNFPVLLMTL